MTNYYTEFITVNNINVDDYININDDMCKVLETSNTLLSNNEYVYTIKSMNLDKKIYTVRIHYNNKIHSLNKQILKYNFLYTYQIWKLSDNNEYIKIKDDFISYEFAEEYLKENNIFNNFYIIRNIDNIDDVINFY
jgi:translation elongation factor P/translation initiation factor 5A